VHIPELLPFIDSDPRPTLNAAGRATRTSIFLNNIKLLTPNLEHLTRPPTSRYASYFPAPVPHDRHTMSFATRAQSRVSGASPRRSSPP